MCRNLSMIILVYKYLKYPLKIYEICVLEIEKVHFLEITARKNNFLKELYV